MPRACEQENTGILRNENSPVRCVPEGTGAFYTTGRGFKDPDAPGQSIMKGDTMNACIWVLFALIASVVAPFAARAGEAEAGTVVRLWTDQVLGDEAGGKEKSTTSPKGDGTLIKLTNVTDPIMTVYKPTKVADSGTAVWLPGWR